MQQIYSKWINLIRNAWSLFRFYIVHHHFDIVIGGSNNLTTDSCYNDMSIKSPSTFQILHMVIQSILFFVGFYFQVRTILVCIEEKNKTWQIHIVHSIIMSVYYGFTIPFHPIIYFIPSLATYVGSWICYISA